MHDLVERVPGSPLIGRDSLIPGVGDVTPKAVTCDGKRIDGPDC
jgi:hypothetical protein